MMRNLRLEADFAVYLYVKLNLFNDCFLKFLLKVSK